MRLAYGLHKPWPWTVRACGWHARWRTSPLGGYACAPDLRRAASMAQQSASEGGGAGPVKLINATTSPRCAPVGCKNARMSVRHRRRRGRDERSGGGGQNARRATRGVPLIAAGSGSAVSGCRGRRVCLAVRWISIVSIPASVPSRAKPITSRGPGQAKPPVPGWPVYGHLRVAHLLPLDGGRRLRRDVVAHAVDTAHLVDYPVRDRAEHLVRHVVPAEC